MIWQIAVHCHVQYYECQNISCLKSKLYFMSNIRVNIFFFFFSTFFVDLLCHNCLQCRPDFATLVRKKSHKAKASHFRSKHTSSFITIHSEFQYRFINTYRHRYSHIFFILKGSPLLTLSLCSGSE